MLKKESYLPQKYRTVFLLYKEQMEIWGSLLRRRWWLFLIFLQPIIQWTRTSGGLTHKNSTNSQLLNSYKTCIFTSQSGLTKTASHPKREVSVAQTGPPQPDCELHNITGILPTVDIADLYICYDSFLARASKMSWEGAPF